MDQVILNSWKRCSRFGVDPLTDELLDVDFSNVSFENEVLMSLSDRINPGILDLMVKRELVLAVTDSKGRFVFRQGANKAVNDAERLGFMVNADWSEESVGTNAVGTALAEGFPLQVFGREHFRESHHAFRCTASPFFSPSGRLMGCVDISSGATIDHTRNFEIVIGVSRFFERLLLEAHASEMRAWPAAILGEIGPGYGGLVVVDSDGNVCGCDPRALDVLGPRAGAAHGRPAGEIFDMAPISKMGNLVHLSDNDKFLIKTRRAPYVVAEVKKLRSPSGLWLGLILKLIEPDALGSSMSRAVRSQKQFAKLPAWSFLGDSEASVATRRLLQALAQTPTTVLLTGESGTGKERAARAIHAMGPRWNAPFVPVNCGAFSESLIQSELFGYVQGAFTGADRKGRPGLFEQADGGVIFLDEIGELPLRQQVNLLRVLDEKAITRVGGSGQIPINVKVIAATNRDLAQETASGRFREDLFHRLNVMTVCLPPLRERLQDLKPIAEWHLARLVGEMGLPELTIGPEAMGLMLGHDWPGNVRSLVNALEYACNQYFLSPFSQIGPEHLPSLASQAERIGPPEPAEGRFEIVPSEISEVEKAAIVAALRRHEYNITRAAKALGIGRNTLYAKLRKYSIDRGSNLGPRALGSGSLGPGD
jgi:transcriptional regulator of acetoin/glycerol metabolism